MKSNNQEGFSIIETMLFLGLTSLLVLGVLVSAGSSINIQRYRDSIRSLQSILQQQFSEVANVSNNNLTNLCGGVSVPRGQSDCVNLGRYITTTDGKKLAIKSVVSTVSPSLGTVTNDITALSLYNIAVSSASADTYDLAWNTSVVKPGGNNPALFSMLILRSPTSGVIKTFIDPDVSVPDNSIRTLINTTTLGNSVKLCVNSNGLYNGVKSAVFINARATSATAIETQGEALSGC